MTACFSVMQKQSKMVFKLKKEEINMQITDGDFHEITLDDKAWMDKHFAKDNRNACEYSFANNYVWRKVYQVEVAEVCGCLVIRFVEDGGYCYSYPVGAGDKKAAIEQLLRMCEQSRTKLKLSPLDEADRTQLLEWFPERFLIEPDRDSYDYIYEREKLVSLAGKKLHGKRNHIARFKDGGAWSYEPMTEENIEECRRMSYAWMEMRAEKWSEEMEREVMVLHEAFDHMGELGLVGGVLRRDGDIVAFSMGEPLNTDTFVVHFEKAYPDIQGAYPMINQQFVQNACEGFAYVNREDDTGDMGLRKAKLSYYPEILLKKYVAVESDVVYADRDRDGAEIAQIWQTCFGDEEDYIEFYMDNRMTEDNMLVVCEDGRIVSMASFLPARYLCEDGYVDARYVYAVATLPEYRRRGYAGRILRFAGEHYQQPLILAPAEEDLVRYYERMGFRRAFPDTRMSMAQDMEALALPDEERVDPVITPVSAKEYVRMRDEKCAGEGYVSWDEAAVSYVMKLCVRGGGQAVTVHRRGDEDAAETVDFLMYQKEEEELVIVETSLEKEALQELLPYLMRVTKTCKVRLGQMPGMIWLPERMADRNVSEKGYLALTME